MSLCWIKVLFSFYLIDPTPLYAHRAVLRFYWWTLPLRCLLWCPLIGLFDLIPVISFKKKQTAAAHLPNVFIYVSCVAGVCCGWYGKGYLKYLYQIEEGKETFHLSLRLKTSAAQGTVTVHQCPDWGKLEVQHVSLPLLLSCTKSLLWANRCKV